MGGSVIPNLPLARLERWQGEKVVGPLSVCVRPEIGGTGCGMHGSDLHLLGTGAYVSTLVFINPLNECRLGLPPVWLTPSL